MTTYRVTFTVEVAATSKPAAVNAARATVRYDPALVAITVEADPDLASAQEVAP